LPSCLDLELVTLSLKGATGGLESEEDAFSALGISEEEGGFEVIISNWKGRGRERERETVDALELIYLC